MMIGPLTLLRKQDSELYHQRVCQELMEASRLVREANELCSALNNGLYFRLTMLLSVEGMRGFVEWPNLFSFPQHDLGARGQGEQRARDEGREKVRRKTKAKKKGKKGGRAEISGRKEGQEEEQEKKHVEVHCSSELPVHLDVL